MLKQEHIPNIYLIHGSEQYLCDIAYNMVRGLIPSEMESSCLSLISGDRINPEELVETVEAMPMLGGSRMVIIDNPNIAKISADGYEAIMEVVSDMPPYSILVINIKGEFDHEKNKRCKELVAAVDKHGAVLSFLKPSEKDVVNFIIKTLKKANKDISRDTAQFMVSYCGSNMANLDNELKKLSSLNDTEITTAHISDITIMTVEAQIFDLAKKIMAKNPQEAMTVIHKLKELRLSEIEMMAALSRYFADLYRGKISFLAGVSQAEAAVAFGYKAGDFRIKNAYSLSASYSTETLTKVLEIITTGDQQLKSSRIDNFVVMERVVAQIILTIHQGHK